MKNPPHFNVPFLTLFWWSKKSTLFPRTFSPCNFAGRKIHIVSTYFFCRDFFGGQDIHVFFHVLFFDTISIVEKSTLLPLTFFILILMVEKSTLFARTFTDKISMGKNLTSILVQLQPNGNIRGFPLLVTLKSWLLQDCPL